MTAVFERCVTFHAISTPTVNFQMKKEYESNGLQNIFTSDITRLLDLAETGTDLLFVSTILRASLQDNGDRVLKEFPMLVHRLFIRNSFRELAIVIIDQRKTHLVKQKVYYGALIFFTNPRTLAPDQVFFAKRR